MRHTTQPISDTALGQLPTSRFAPNQITAVFAVLRDKAPQRPLSRSEAERVAEWQAQALLQMGRVTSGATPSELITELPRVQVARDADLPVSGCLQWSAGRWLILLNGSEPLERQRFSLAHEFKHAVDHRYRETYYVDVPGDSAQAQAEHAADWFAASLLMPRREVQRAWYGGDQHIEALARRFCVSPQAMSRRLQCLGIRDAVPRAA